MDQKARDLKGLIAVTHGMALRAADRAVDTGSNIDYAIASELVKRKFRLSDELYELTGEFE